MLADAGSDQRGERGHLHSRLGTGRKLFTKRTKSPDQIIYGYYFKYVGGGG